MHHVVSLPYRLWGNSHHYREGIFLNVNMN